MKVILCDRNEPLVDIWKAAFRPYPEVEVVQADICNGTWDAVVSPANSFSFMDGGLDYHLSKRFGWGLQERLQERIKQRPARELLVGEALVIETHDAQVPYLISAPTMRVPMRIGQTVNAYLAMKAILNVSNSHPNINSVAIPGLGTGVGDIPPNICASQMLAAYEEIIKGVDRYPKGFQEAQARHLRLNGYATIL